MVIFQFHKKFTGSSFCDGRAKNLQILRDIDFDSGFQNIVLSNLLLFLCVCYINWSRWYSINEITNLTARNFNSSRLLYHYFSKMSNFFPNIRFINNSNCKKFLFWRKSHQKTPIFRLFKGILFCNGRLYWYEWWRVLRNFCRLSQKCSFVTFPKLSRKLS